MSVLLLTTMVAEGHAEDAVEVNYQHIRTGSPEIVTFDPPYPGWGGLTGHALAFGRMHIGMTLKIPGDGLPRALAGFGWLHLVDTGLPIDHALRGKAAVGLALMADHGTSPPATFGNGPIVVSFDRPVCAIGYMLRLPSPSHGNRVDTDLIDAEGREIASLWREPAGGTTRQAFATADPLRPIAAYVVRSSPRGFSLDDLVWQDCAPAIS